jgi:mRNA-degrading endonuclease RelE of RelBE toxin-antitoxin system
MNLIISKKADRQLSKLNPFVRRKILKNLRQFKEGEKVDIKKMKGKTDEYRIRVGDFRALIKNFRDNDYLVAEIGKRENIYILTF